MAEVVENTEDVEAGEVKDFVETSEESYCGRMQNACAGVFLGLMLFFGSFALLVWNEGRAVQRAKDIDEGREIVIPINVTAIATSNNNTNFAQYDKKLVYVNGNLGTNETVMDPIFGVGSNRNGEPDTLKLSRQVEMYQWEETATTSTRKTSTGSTQTTTTYKYRKEWSRTLIDSSTFRDNNESRINPTEFPFPPEDYAAGSIYLEEILKLEDDIVSRLDWYESVNDVHLDDVPDSSLRADLALFSSGFYYGKGTYQDPQVGDTRITFSQVKADQVSIIAMYTSGNKLDTYTTSRGNSLLIVKRGSYSAEVLFQQADDENTTMAWILRFLGFLLMFFSILMMLQPLAIAVDIVPFLGDYMESGMQCCLFPLIASLIAIPASLFTIALAWLAYRPMWSIPILVVSGTILAMFYCRHRNKMQHHEANMQQSSEPDKLDVGDQPATSHYYPNATNTSTVLGIDPVSSPQDNYGSFSGALNAPPPTAPPAYQDEPDLDLSAPPKPFVPQVYK
jgi:hypothetical protein